MCYKICIEISRIYIDDILWISDEFNGMFVEYDGCGAFSFTWVFKCLVF